MDNCYGERDEFHWQEKHLDIHRLSKRKIIYFSQTQVYKIKEGPRGEVNTIKARFVTLDFKQKVKIDYEEMFVLVVKWPIVQTLNALAASNG